MKIIEHLVALFGGACVFVALVAVGFTVAASPPATHVLGGLLEDNSSSPYTKEDLLYLADATRTFTVDPYGAGGQEGALELLAQICIDSGRSSAQAGEKNDYWQSEASQVLDAATSENSVRALYALAEIDTSYALDPDAVSHLVDCNVLINNVRPWLAGAALGALAAWIVLAALKARRSLGHMLAWPSALLMLAFLALGVWAAIDFSGFFSAFHDVFFPQGNWTFDARSLLITMYPQEFWVALGALWLAVSLLAAIIFLVLGRHYAKSIGKHARS